jgi:hypothetical protein
MREPGVLGPGLVSAAFQEGSARSDTQRGANTVPRLSRRSAEYAKTSPVPQRGVLGLGADLTCVSALTAVPALGLAAWPAAALPRVAPVF